MTANRYDFNDRTVLVTGGGSGMGRAIARGFLENGARVVVSGRRAEPLQETIAGYGGDRALAITADVSSLDSVQSLVGRAVDAFSGLDVVVCNAGALETGELVDLPQDRWRALFATNVDGLYHLVQAAAGHLVASKGNVVAISSVSGLGGDWGQAAYNATKHAVNGLVRSLALDYGGRGVRFNAIAPAFTETAMNQGVWGDGGDVSAFTNRVALGRTGQAEDVVGAALFLASADAAYITGAVLPVDGGTSASTGQPHR